MPLKHLLFKTFVERLFSYLSFAIYIDICGRIKNKKLYHPSAVNSEILFKCCLDHMFKKSFWALLRSFLCLIIIKLITQLFHCIILNMF